MLRTPLEERYDLPHSRRTLAAFLWALIRPADRFPLIASVSPQTISRRLTVEVQITSEVTVKLISVVYGANSTMWLRMNETFTMPGETDHLS